MAQRGSWASYVIWGCIAVCAVLGASLTIALVVGAHRGVQVAAPAKRVIPPATERQQANVPAPASETRELAALEPPLALPAATRTDIARIDDALRSLVAERDRLTQRLEQIERSLGDITASINQRAAALPPEPPPTAPRPTIPASAIAPERIQPAEPVAQQAQRAPSPRAGAIRPAPPVSDPTEIFRVYADARPLAEPVPTQAPMQIQAAELQAATRATETVTTRTEFAVDLGGEASVDGLRALWTNLRGNHGASLANLRPLVAVRDSGRAGVPELRLIAGPLANAGAAARTCAALQAKGVTCQTTVFDGQRLALR